MNDLEKLFIVLNSMVEGKLKDNPKSGLIVNKGEATEVKMRYRDVKKTLDSLEYYMLTRQEISSHSVCKECRHFDQRQDSKYFGTCLVPLSKNEITNTGKCMNVLDTCWRNTDSRRIKK